MLYESHQVSRSAMSDEVEDRISAFRLSRLRRIQSHGSKLYELTFTIDG